MTDEQSNAEKAREIYLNAHGEPGLNPNQEIEKIKQAIDEAEERGRQQALHNSQQKGEG